MALSERELPATTLYDLMASTDIDDWCYATDISAGETATNDHLHSGTAINP